VEYAEVWYIHVVILERPIYDSKQIRMSKELYSPTGLITFYSNKRNEITDLAAGYTFNCIYTTSLKN